MDNVGASESETLTKGHVQATNPLQPSHDDNLEETLDDDAEALNDEVKEKCENSENCGKSDNTKSNHADQVDTSHGPFTRC